MFKISKVWRLIVKIELVCGVMMLTRKERGEVQCRIGLALTIRFPPSKFLSLIKASLKLEKLVRRPSGSKSGIHCSEYCTA